MDILLGCFYVNFLNLSSLPSKRYQPSLNCHVYIANMQLMLKMCDNYAN